DSLIQGDASSPNQHCRLRSRAIAHFGKRSRQAYSCLCAHRLMLNGSRLKNVVIQSLLRKSLAARNPELCFRQWSCSRLAPSHADAIGSLGDNSISLFVHLAQVARIQCEVDMLGFTGTERYPLERAQSANRRDWRFWKTHV